MFRSIYVLLTATLFLAAEPAAVLAETRTVTDDLGRIVAVPKDANRIVVLHDKNLTIPLIELGIIPTASHGRMSAQGIPFIRGSRTVTGHDFDVSPIRFIGSNPIDVEMVAAADPDLIISSPWMRISANQLSAIAPTVVIDTIGRDTPEVFTLLAEVTGKTDELEILQRRYNAQIAQLRQVVDTEAITVNVLQAVNNEFYIQHTYSSLGRVLRDAGFGFPEAVNAIQEGTATVMSPEMLPALDADILFLTYRTDKGERPADALNSLERTVPGWCSFSHACQHGQIHILPREEATAASYDGLMAVVLTVLVSTSSQQITTKRR